MGEQVASAATISVPKTVLQTLRDPAAVGAAVRYLRTVLKDFFWLQFSVKWGVHHVPIVHVDDPLDERVHFRPDLIGVYLDFVGFWIRPIGMIGRRFGRRAQCLAAVEFLALMDRCYREAAEVYRVTMSTTRRPRHLRGRFRMVHLFDPHYMCVPSLHVMIVAATRAFHRRKHAELGAKPAQLDALDDELLAGAVAITESVLYVKQHSVNCIPAALYAISRIMPQDVSRSQVAELAGRLFRGAPDVSQADAALIRDHVLTRFDRLTSAGRADEYWPTTVRRMLDTLVVAG